MNYNKNDIINTFTNGNNKELAIDDNTSWVCRIICLIEFYNNDSIVAYLDNNEFNSLCTCYLDDNNIIHISTTITKCNIPSPNKECIELYNNSNISRGYKIRAVYFKDHIDKYSARNLRSNIIRKFRYNNRCIDDISGNMLNIVGLIELNNKESDLLAITGFTNQIPCICYLDNNNELHKSKYTYSILKNIEVLNRENIIKHNMFSPVDIFKIKCIYFDNYTYNVL